jgi:hypothetical protein
MPYAIARAIRNAAAAASPPISTVCIALLSGAAPVKCPLMYPKTASAISVRMTDMVNAVLTVETSMYGLSGMKPPAI